MAAAGREVWGEFRPPLRCRVKGERRHDCSPSPTASAARAGLSHTAVWDGTGAFAPVRPDVSGLPARQPKTPHLLRGRRVACLYPTTRWGKAGDGGGSRARKRLTSRKGAQLSPTAEPPAIVPLE